MRSLAITRHLRLGATMLASMLLLTTARTAPAQQPEPDLGSLPTGKAVRVRDAAGLRLEAVLLHADPDSLVFTSPDGTRVLGAAVIDSVWVRGNRTGMGALLGAGAVFVPLYVAAVSTECNLLLQGHVESECGLVTYIVLGGIAVGATIDAQVGSRLRRWQLRYARLPAGAGKATAWPSRHAAGISVRF